MSTTTVTSAPRHGLRMQGGEPSQGPDKKPARCVSVRLYTPGPRRDERTATEDRQDGRRPMKAEGPWEKATTPEQHEKRGEGV